MKDSASLRYRIQASEGSALIVRCLFNPKMRLGNSRKTKIVKRIVVMGTTVALLVLFPTRVCTVLFPHSFTESSKPPRH